MQKNKDISTKEKDLSLGKNMEQLQRVWENLQKAQEKALYRSRKSKAVGQISSVKIISDQFGKQSVQINLVGGGRITDIGDQKALFQKMIPSKNINIGRIISLLDAVRQYGFAAVAMGLSPAMKTLLLKACKKCGIPLKKAEKQKIIQKNSSRTVSIPSGGENLSKAKLTKISVPSLLHINSLSSLEEQIYKQKENNNKYLQSVLKREENKSKEVYFDRIRLALEKISQMEQNGETLTEEQIQIKKTALRFGLKSEKRKEHLTKRESIEREKMSLRELPQDIKTELKNNKKRYKTICSLKNQAADLVLVKHTHEIETGKNFDLFPADLIREAVDYLPPSNKRDFEHLRSSEKEIRHKKKNKKEEIKKVRKEKRTYATNLMIKTMSEHAKRSGKTLQKQLNGIKQQPTYRPAQRQSFMSNALMQEIIRQRQAER